MLCRFHLLARYSRWRSVIVAHTCMLCCLADGLTAWPLACFCTCRLMSISVYNLASHRVVCSSVFTVHTWTNDYWALSHLLSPPLPPSLFHQCSVACPPMEFAFCRRPGAGVRSWATKHPGEPVIVGCPHWFWCCQKTEPYRTKTTVFSQKPNQKLTNLSHCETVITQH